MKVVAIVQARMGSTRLPGKVLLDLAGEPMLARVMNRLARAETLNQVVVATTVESGDAPIVDLCESRGWACFRGSEKDVLDRYYRAAQTYQADVVVRVTSDCPLIEPKVVDFIVQEYLEGQPAIDYVSNISERTYPRGLDTEVFGFDALEQAWREDDDPDWREHVTPYILYNAERFHSKSFLNGQDYSYLRWTVDTAEDLAFVRHIYDHFGHDRFSWQEVLVLLNEYPEWLEINRDVEQKAV